MEVSLEVNQVNPLDWFINTLLPNKEQWCWRNFLDERWTVLNTKISMYILQLKNPCVWFPNFLPIFIFECLPVIDLKQIFDTMEKQSVPVICRIELVSFKTALSPLSPFSSPPAASPNQTQSLHHISAAVRIQGFSFFSFFFISFRSWERIMSRNRQIVSRGSARLSQQKGKCKKYW